MRIIDNEYPKIAKDYIKTIKNIELMLVPSYLYQVNAAEKAIDIFKNYFIVSLTMVDPSFPLHL